jgi:hypothetical protein
MGRAVDSNSPQSRTRPVILPAERRASRWLEANDMDGTWRFSKRILAMVSFT